MTARIADTFVNSNNYGIISQNLKIVGLLGEKVAFFIPLGIQIEIDFHHAKTRIKLYSFRALKRYLDVKNLTQGR